MMLLPVAFSPGFMTEVRRAGRNQYSWRAIHNRTAADIANLFIPIIRCRRTHHCTEYSAHNRAVMAANRMAHNGTCRATQNHASELIRSGSGLGQANCQQDRPYYKFGFHRVSPFSFDNYRLGPGRNWKISTW
jgi:hypothetical protein